MRNRFGEQLERLHVEMIQMGALCEDAISAAAQALMKGDEDLARAAGEAEREIDQKEREVENLCLKLLLQQQPVARDLREISSALKMISDLERIGDQAADIAELTRFVRLPDGPGRQRIEEMSKAVIRMVTDSVDSFVKRDLELAREVCREDDQVDDLFNQVKKELIGLIAADADSGELWLDLIMVASIWSGSAITPPTWRSGWSTPLRGITPPTTERPAHRRGADIEKGEGPCLPMRM